MAVGGILSTESSGVGSTEKMSKLVVISELVVIREVVKIGERWVV